MKDLKGLAAVGIAFWLMFLGGLEAVQVVTQRIQNGATIAIPTVAALSAPTVPTFTTLGSSSGAFVPPVQQPIVVTVVVPAPTPVPGATPVPTAEMPAYNVQTGPKVIVIKNGNNPAAAPIVVTDGTKRRGRP